MSIAGGTKTCFANGPVNTKFSRGIRRFHRPGLAAGRTESRLIAATHSLLSCTVRDSGPGHLSKATVGRIPRRSTPTIARQNNKGRRSAAFAQQSQIRGLSVKRLKSLELSTFCMVGHAMASLSVCEPESVTAPSERGVPIGVPTDRHTTRFRAIYFYVSPCKCDTLAFLVAAHNPKVGGSNPAPGHCPRYSCDVSGHVSQVSRDIGLMFGSSASGRALCCWLRQ